METINQTRLPLAQRFRIAQQAMQRVTQSITTLAMLDEEADFEPLDDLIQARKPERCESIEFLDDRTSGTRRQLFYTARIQCGTVRGTESRWESEPKYETVNVWANVQPGMDIEIIARLVVSEIDAEIDNALNC